MAIVALQNWVCRNITVAMLHTHWLSLTLQPAYDGSLAVTWVPVAQWPSSSNGKTIKLFLFAISRLPVVDPPSARPCQVGVPVAQALRPPAAGKIKITNKSSTYL